MKKMFGLLLSIFAWALLASCAKDLGLTGGQGVATTENFLQTNPYPENRELNLQRDMEIMWTQEQYAGHPYSTVAARSAIRRVFADVNLNFKGTKEEFYQWMTGTPTETKADRYVYRIEAPTYTDEYDVIFNADNTFKGVEYNRKYRMKQDTGYR